MNDLAPESSHELKAVELGVSYIVDELEDMVWMWNDICEDGCVDRRDVVLRIFIETSKDVVSDMQDSIASIQDVTATAISLLEAEKAKDVE